MESRSRVVFLSMFSYWTSEGNVQDITNGIWRERNVLSGTRNERTVGHTDDCTAQTASEPSIYSVTPGRRILSMGIRWFEALVGIITVLSFLVLLQ
jgi:hypothetical protein